MTEQWVEQFDELEEEKNHDAEVFLAMVFLLFTDSIRQIEKYVAAWFGRYGEMTPQDARRTLTPVERKEFQLTVKGYIADGINDKWVRKLEHLQSKMRVSRLDVLTVQVQHTLEKLFGEYSKEIDNFMFELYVDQHNHVLFELAKGVGKSKVFEKVDMDKLRKLLGDSWAVDGKTYSARIWENKTKLMNEIDNVIGKGLIRGDSCDTMTREIAKRMNVSYSNAERLVKTESAFISSEAEREAYKKFGVKRYQYIAIRDNRTSEICRYMDRRVFLVSEMKVGLNAPPLHCYCRSTTCPYFDESDTFDGKTVNTGMTYEQWEQMFLK